MRDGVYTAPPFILARAAEQVIAPYVVCKPQNAKGEYGGLSADPRSKVVELTHRFLNCILTAKSVCVSQI